MWLQGPSQQQLLHGDLPDFPPEIFHMHHTQQQGSAEGPKSLPGDDALEVVLLGFLWLHPGGKSLMILTKLSGNDPSLPLSCPTSHSSLSRLTNSTWSPSVRSSSPGFSAVKENVASQYGPLETHKPLP